MRNLLLRELAWLRWPTMALIGLAAILAVDAKADHSVEEVTNTVTAVTVKRILDAGENLILIDLRPEMEFRKKRLPHAHSIPSDEMETRLPEIPKFGRVVLYCACRVQEIVEKANALRRLGYRNVAAMPEGYPGWLRLGYPVEESP